MNPYINPDILRQYGIKRNDWGRLYSFTGVSSPTTSNAIVAIALNYAYAHPHLRVALVDTSCTIVDFRPKLHEVLKPRITRPINGGASTFQKNIKVSSRTIPSEIGENFPKNLDCYFTDYNPKWSSLEFWRAFLDELREQYDTIIASVGLEQLMRNETSGVTGTFVTNCEKLLLCTTATETNCRTVNDFRQCVNPYITDVVCTVYPNQNMTEAINVVESVILPSKNDYSNGNAKSPYTYDIVDMMTNVSVDSYAENGDYHIIAQGLNSMQVNKVFELRK